MKRNDWRELISAAEHAVTELADIHDTHVYSEDDVHPTDCKLCAITNRLKAAVATCRTELEKI